MTSMPGAGRGRCWLANSASACDTAGMAPLSRALKRWHPVRVASVALGLAVLIVLASYVVAAAASPPTVGAVVAALCLLAIGGTGLLYAWRLGAGAPAE